MHSVAVAATAHTGVTVSDIDASLAFYRDVLGLTVSEKLDCKGETYEQVTGVRGAHIVIAYVHAPGHTIELLQYLNPPDRGSANSRPCDTGAMHIAFRVKDIAAVIAAVRNAGLIPVSPFIPEFPEGRSRGLRAVYTRDPDGVIIEFVEDPRISD